jgi:hypothetical protein
LNSLKRNLSKKLKRNPKYECKHLIFLKDSKDNDEGYVQKLVLKIIDNIQIEIKNIHIRFEDTSTNQYSWGIALNKIDIFTTDKEWNKFYFDRTKEENVISISCN